ncbi:MAG: enoyl-CoA hydratase, partial [Betaproteobacteria bacterium]|nr:enoyl-CoA hydratase [Betaproteobacteria bacterium]
MSTRHLPGQPHALPRHNTPLTGYQAEHFLLDVSQGV